MPQNKNKNKYEYKGLSARTKRMLTQEEGYDIEFKESAGSIDNSDLVAFANSDSGGTILVGIKEKKDASGRQIACIVGCPVGDKQKQKIISKASNCMPPIDIDVFTENVSTKKPIFRVEIAAGKDKPYSTMGGLYKKRVDGSNKALLPPELSLMLLDLKSNEFVERFRAATVELEQELGSLHEKVGKEFATISNIVSSMKNKIEEDLYSIMATAEGAESLSDEAMHLSDQAASSSMDLIDITAEIADTVKWLGQSIKLILDKNGLEDPTTTNFKYRLLIILKALETNPRKQTQKNILSMTQNTLPEVFDEVILEWVNEYKDGKWNHLEDKAGF
jgi:hypothetical protein